jgi:Flp pilus assembly protein TadB
MTAIPERPAKTVSASVSNVGQPLSVDQSSRARKYFISMMVRTACFILAVVLPSPYRWIALFGAVVLPYVAVVVANAGRESIRGQATIISPGPREIGNK